MSENPIGLFDSGLGGLSVLRRLTSALPAENAVYFADTAHMPYGARTPEDIRCIVYAICDFLVRRSCKMIVMACNTSSALALPEMQASFPVPVIGVINPAVEAAAQVAERGVLALATQATIKSGVYNERLKARRPDLDVVGQPCPLLVPLVESGVFSGPEIDSALDSYLAPAKSHPVDTVILGCTHYPFLADSITRKLQGARLVDPAEHVVVQIRKELEVNNLLNPSSEPGTVQYYTSGSPRDFDHLAALLLEHPVTCQKASFSVKPNGALRVD